MATFLERAGAYLIDTIIISIIFTVICYSLPTNTVLEKQMTDLSEKLTSGEIVAQEYIDEYQEIIYDYQKANVLSSSINVALTIAYFVIFQYLNKGRTLGKKLLKLQVVDVKNSKPVTIIQMFIRNICIMSIASGILNILFIYIFNKKSYFTGYMTTLGIEAIFTIISIIFILYKKDKRGLHDIMAKTSVIKERG